MENALVMIEFNVEMFGLRGMVLDVRKVKFLCNTLISQTIIIP